MYYVVIMPSSIYSNNLLRKTKYITELIIYNLLAANLLHNTPFAGCLCWLVMVIGLSSSGGTVNRYSLLSTDEWTSL